MVKILQIGMKYNTYNSFKSFLKSFLYRISEKIILFIVRRKKENLVTNQSPLVSIIIATYNRSEILINRTIPSVLNQSYKNIEVIIVGDRCVDNTSELLEKNIDPRIIFYDLKEL